MVWSLALRPDGTKQDRVVYGTKFGVVFLAEGLPTASIQKGFDCFGLYHPGLEMWGQGKSERRGFTSTLLPCFSSPWIWAVAARRFSVLNSDLDGGFPTNSFPPTTDLRG